MINDIKKSRRAHEENVDAYALNRIRTGRARNIEDIVVDYYGADAPLQQLANINVEDSRTLSITPWEKAVVPAIEKAIMTYSLGLNPNTAGAVIRIPMPALTEETRKNFIKHANRGGNGACFGA